MKNRALYCTIAISIFMLFNQGIVNAQSFTFTPNDTIYAVSSLEFLSVENYFQAVSSDIECEWIVRELELPTGWEFYSLCDNNLCYFSPPDSAIMNPIRVSDGPTENRILSTFKMNNSDTSIAKLVLEVRAIDNSFSHLFTYFFQRKITLSVLENQTPQLKFRTYDNRVSFINPFLKRAKYQALDFSGRLLVNGEINRDEQATISLDTPFILLITSDDKTLSRKIVPIKR